MATARATLLYTIDGLRVQQRQQSMAAQHQAAAASGNLGQGTCRGKSPGSCDPCAALHGVSVAAATLSRVMLLIKARFAVALAFRQDRNAAKRSSLFLLQCSSCSIAAFAVVHERGAAPKHLPSVFTARERRVWPCVSVGSRKAVLEVIVCSAAAVLNEGVGLQGIV